MKTPVHLKFFPQKQSFTLLEVVLALGVVSFALVAILGLLPVALATAKDGENETRVALLAQSLHSDLQSRRGLMLSPSSGFDTILLNGSSNQHVCFYTRDGELTDLHAPDKFFQATVTVIPGPPALTNGWQIETAFTWPGASLPICFISLLGP